VLHKAALSAASCPATSRCRSPRCKQSQPLLLHPLQEALEARSQLRRALETSQEEGSKLGQQVQALAGELARHRDALQQEKLSAASLQVGAGRPNLPGDLPAVVMSKQPAGWPLLPTALAAPTPACPQLELQRVRSQLGLAHTEKELLQAELSKQAGEASSSALKLSAASREAGQLAALQPRVEELQQEVRGLTAHLEASRKEVGGCWACWQAAGQARLACLTACPGLLLWAALLLQCRTPFRPVLLLRCSSCAALQRSPLVLPATQPAAPASCSACWTTPATSASCCSPSWPRPSTCSALPTPGSGAPAALAAWHACGPLQHSTATRPQRCLPSAWTDCATAPARRALESERDQVAAERQQLEAQLGKMAGDVDRHSTTATAADANVRSLQLQLVSMQAQAAQQEQEVQRLQASAAGLAPLP
jgi:hypothetical protein